jgi:hypothetical protein
MASPTVCGALFVDLCVLGSFVMSVRKQLHGPSSVSPPTPFLPFSRHSFLSIHPFSSLPCSSPVWLSAVFRCAALVSLGPAAMMLFSSLPSVGS